MQMIKILILVITQEDFIFVLHTPRGNVTDCTVTIKTTQAKTKHVRACTVTTLSYDALHATQKV